jgi:hypothetical protein
MKMPAAELLINLIVTESRQICLDVKKVCRRLVASRSVTSLHARWRFIPSLRCDTVHVTNNRNQIVTDFLNANPFLPKHL